MHGLSMILSVLGVQATYLWAVMIFDRDAPHLAAVGAGLLALILNITATACDSISRGRAEQVLSYVSAGLAICGACVAIAWLIQWLFRARPVGLADMLAAGLVLLGLAIHALRDWLPDWMR